MSASRYAGPVDELDAAEARAGSAPVADTAPVSPDRFRMTMAQMPTGVSIISTAGPGGMAGVTCSAVAALSNDPPLVSVCIHRHSRAAAALKANRVLCVNCLSAAQADVALLFSGVGSVPMQERFGRGSWGILATGAPHSLDALVALDCELVDVRDIGTHSLFIAKVVATAEADGLEPLIYHRQTFGSTRPV